ncbi:MAG: hypothetical protein NVSMB18_18200 [Acetobacteraceae bacterium]
MTISVVITTRNRPTLLARALASVTAQRDIAFEIIVVDDGSKPDHAEQHAALAGGLGTRGRFHTLPPTPTGHGPSFARNHGVAQASFLWVAFLDDDDEWTDPDYLAISARTLAATEGADLHYANQVAIRPDGTQIEESVWIEDLAGILQRSRPARTDGTWLATAPELLRSNGFSHLNTTIVRKAFFETLGGFDLSLRYEEDRDFHLRAIDAAAVIVHAPRTVALHYVPQSQSASTTLTPDQRALDQLRVLDKAILNSKRPEIRAYAKRFKVYTLKNIAHRRYAAGDLGAAAFYAREALGIGFNPKWLGFTGWLTLRAR